MMITDEEAKKAAEVLKEYCSSRNVCDGCPLGEGWDCYVSVS